MEVYKILGIIAAILMSLLFAEAGYNATDWKIKVACFSVVIIVIIILGIIIYKSKDKQEEQQ